MGHRGWDSKLLLMGGKGGYVFGSREGGNLQEVYMVKQERGGIEERV